MTRPSRARVVLGVQLNVQALALLLAVLLLTGLVSLAVMSWLERAT